MIKEVSEAITCDKDNVLVYEINDANDLSPDNFKELEQLLDEGDGKIDESDIYICMKEILSSAFMPLNTERGIHSRKKIIIKRTDQGIENLVTIRNGKKHGLEIRREPDDAPGKETIVEWFHDRVKKVWKDSLKMMDPNMDRYAYYQPLEKTNKYGLVPHVQNGRFFCGVQNCAKVAIQDMDRCHKHKRENSFEKI
jgi:hypothetical protein